MIEVFLGGMLGPILLELVKLAALKDRKRLEARYTRGLYWALTLVLAVVAGIITIANGTVHVPLIRAIELGINAPAVISGFATAATPKKIVPVGEPAGFMSKVAPALEFKPGWTELLSWH